MRPSTMLPELDVDALYLLCERGFNMAMVGKTVELVGSRRRPTARVT